MASTATTSQGNPRSEADPLPSKRGEIGYVGGASPQPEQRTSLSPEATLPARHPADRDTPATSSQESISNLTHSPSRSTLVSPSSTTIASTETLNSTSKKKRVLGFFKSKRIFLGFSLSTFLQFITQLAFIVGSIIGWVVAAKVASRQTLGGFSTTGIFIHVIFGVSLLAQLLFLERRIFRLRAERYSYLHPGEILPSARSYGVMDSSIAYSPWNRPPLPTYAAALAQSGVGTGDVEDHLIAAPPPPAYGNTRGSRLILTGYLRESLRAQRPGSEMSEQVSRPVSYHRSDEQWEEIQDAERARQLEETLARLERIGSRSSR